MERIDYNFDENYNENTFVNIEPGIIENMYLSDVKVSEEDNNSYIEYTFSDIKDTFKVNRRYYEPKIGGFIKNEDDLYKDSVKKKNIIANISRNIIRESYSITGVKTYKDLIRVAAADLKKVIPNKILVRVVVVLNNDNFATLRSFAPVIENMNVNPSKLKLSRYDKLVSSDNKSSGLKESLENSWD